MKETIEKFKSGLITLEEANRILANKGYKLDYIIEGKYYLKPLMS